MTKKVQNIKTFQKFIGENMEEEKGYTISQFNKKENDDISEMEEKVNCVGENGEGIYLSYSDAIFPSEFDGGGEGTPVKQKVYFSKSNKLIAQDFVKPMMDNMTKSIDADIEDVNLICKNITFERVFDKTNVIMIAVDRMDYTNNAVVLLDAGGDPLPGYAYSPENDQYTVLCKSYLFLGIIPVALRIAVNGFFGKQMFPLPKDIIWKYASVQQKELIKEFQERFKGCSFEFVQSICRN